MINNKIKKALLLLLLIPSLGLAQSTTKLTASKANDYGIAYSLPYTTFDIVVETEMTECQPGEFYNYANRYLNVADAVTQPTYSARIKSLTVVPKGLPNEQSRWMMEFKGTGITYVQLNSAGVPIAINTEADESLPAAELPVAVKPSPTALETPAAKQAITQEMIQTTSTSRRAQLTAQRIFELRETRGNLISGESDNTPPDGKSMQLMLDNLEAQEAALTAMFVGTERTWTDVQTITFTPDTEELTKIVVARISPVKGLVGADDLSGKPLTLSMEILSTGDIPTDSNGAPKKAVKDGVAYNIPGVAQISLFYDGEILSSKDYEVAQLGKVFFLDPKLFTDKKSPAFVTFDPVTGGILTIGNK